MIDCEDSKGLRIPFTDSQEGFGHNSSLNSNYLQYSANGEALGMNRPQVSIIIQGHSAAPTCHYNEILENLESAGLHGSHISPSACCPGKFIILQPNKYSAAVGVRVGFLHCKHFPIFSHLHILLQNTNTSNHIDPPIHALIKCVLLQNITQHTHAVARGAGGKIRHICLT